MFKKFDENDLNGWIMAHQVFEFYFFSRNWTFLLASHIECTFWQAVFVGKTPFYMYLVRLKYQPFCGLAPGNGQYSALDYINANKRTVLTNHRLYNMNIAMPV